MAAPRSTPPSFTHELDALLAAIRACTLCAGHLPLGPRPVLQAHPQARILIAGQAPGRRVHETGIPFNDASGKRLMDWLGVPETTFRDPRQFAIVPMGFCFPGTGRAGDLPPRPECAPRWRDLVLASLTQLRLTVVVGRYAQACHTVGGPMPLADAVRAGIREGGGTLVLPHPSPRNNLWLKRHPWFEGEAVPVLRAAVKQALSL